MAEQSSESAEQVSAATQQTSASTQEIAASAQALAGTADQLNELVQRFKVTAERSRGSGRPRRRASDDGALDHHGAPSSICRYPHPGEPTHGRLGGLPLRRPHGEHRARLPCETPHADVAL